MLVLSRKLGERICIADNIEVTIVEIKHGKVRLGIVAPSEVAVHRKEIYDRIVGALVENEDINQRPEPQTP
jgi:carbon storage regulator